MNGHVEKSSSVFFFKIIHKYTELLVLFSLVYGIHLIVLHRKISEKNKFHSVTLETLNTTGF
jgi:hypothetical protein